MRDTVHSELCQEADIVFVEVTDIVDVQICKKGVDRRSRSHGRNVRAKVVFRRFCQMVGVKSVGGSQVRSRVGCGYHWFLLILMCEVVSREGRGLCIQGKCNQFRVHQWMYQFRGMLFSFYLVFGFNRSTYFFYGLSNAKFVFL